MGSENRIQLIHRVLVADTEYPKEYAILITEKRSIFLRQQKTRGTFWLRGEMNWGTALITDVIPKTLGDSDNASLESQEENRENIIIRHDSVRALSVATGEPKFFWLSLSKKPVPVYNFTMTYLDVTNARQDLRFYLVPLGMYFKPRRRRNSREAILREYAFEALETFAKVLPPGVVSYSTRGSLSFAALQSP